MKVDGEAVHAPVTIISGSEIFCAMHMTQIQSVLRLSVCLSASQCACISLTLDCLLLGLPDCLSVPTQFATFILILVPAICQSQIQHVFHNNKGCMEGAVVNNYRGYVERAGVIWTCGVTSLCTF